MEFEELFEGKSWPEVKERLGVMSVDSLNRQWVLVLEEAGYLIARSKDGEAALLGRMGKRDDGKFCIELVVKARIENSTLQLRWTRLNLTVVGFSCWRVLARRA